MKVSSGTAWKPTTFEGPALVGTIAVFARAMPELATRIQTVTAVTACHLWRLEAGEVEELLHGHRVQVFQELLQLRLEVRGASHRVHCVQGLVKLRLEIRAAK